MNWVISLPGLNTSAPTSRHATLMTRISYVKVYFFLSVILMSPPQPHDHDENEDEGVDEDED